ncbi:lipopolysaccharide assembly protein LapB [Lentimicrobium sp. S6]|uniref:tetratricopeptide repeat protein n=1 Tax=Lentimicrobium sp. S6 TaxID=2735872 RepID=UPI001552C006|nr:tetratricopeptide repeat protein [Lentimicrobium sp. S6]NPD47863.1 tetratricopeptide repeat protein [Lentimicrobium sp. S6]
MNSNNLIFHKLSLIKQRLTNILVQVLGKSKNQPEWYYSNKGNQLIEEGHLSGAEALFTKMMQVHPESHVPYIGLARVAKKQQDWDNCIKYYQSCLEKFPNKVKEFWFLHLAEANIKKSNFKDAENLLKTCSKKYPESEASFVELAMLSQKTQQWQQAYDYWQVCFKQFPEKVRPLWHQKKQRVLIELGQSKEAQQEALSRIELLGGEKYVDIFNQKHDNKDSHNLKYQHILIITYGRSGSTLLQGILNTIDGVIIRGENENIFFDLYQTYKKLLQLKNSHKTAVLPNQPWFGISFINENLLLSQYQELAKTILLAESASSSQELCLGFKEIRYDKVGDEFETYLDFLTQLFPKTAFIFNTRNLKDVSNSAWWRDKKPEQVIEELSHLETQFKAYSDKHNYCFQIDYSDVISKGEKLKGLFDFLGAPYKPNTIDTVLSTPHSYSPEQKHIKKLFKKF